MEHVKAWCLNIANHLTKFKTGAVIETFTETEAGQVDKALNFSTFKAKTDHARMSAERKKEKLLLLLETNEEVQKLAGLLTKFSPVFSTRDEMMM